MNNFRFQRRLYKFYLGTKFYEVTLRGWNIRWNSMSRWRRYSGCSKWETISRRNWNMPEKCDLGEILRIRYLFLFLSVPAVSHNNYETLCCSIACHVMQRPLTSRKLSKWLNYRFVLTSNTLKSVRVASMWSICPGICPESLQLVPFFLSGVVITSTVHCLNRPILPVLILRSIAVCFGWK